MARLEPERRSFFNETDRLLRLLNSTASIETTHRRVIAEIIHLRLAILVENHLQNIISKICCAASYLDGSTPVLLIAQPSRARAYAAMKSLNRPAEFNVRWNNGRSIRRGVQHIIAANDHCLSVMLNFGSFLTDMRYIRNHIAHRNEGSRTNFRKLVRRYYGATPPGITSGMLLLSSRVSSPRPLVEMHILIARVLIKDLVKG
jgi:hypothetical protein